MSEKKNKESNKEIKRQMTNSLVQTMAMQLYYAKEIMKTIVDEEKDTKMKSKCYQMSKQWLETLESEDDTGKE